MTQPYESLERTLEKVATWRDDRAAGGHYAVTEAPDERAHQLISAEWPCEELGAFSAVWASIQDDLAAHKLRVGRGAFGGWDDGDAQLVRLAWCLVRHLRPARILETGVARGFTTRALLEALERNEGGHLWSIDLPPLLEHGLAEQTAVAVPPRLYDRWTMVRGSSRRVLAGVVAELGAIDLFIHDSMHTTRNVLFELECVWPALAPGGAILIDDVEKNAAMGQFLKTHPGTPSMICTSNDGEALIGCLIKGAGIRPPTDHEALLATYVKHPAEQQSCAWPDRNEPASQAPNAARKPAARPPTENAKQRKELDGASAQDTARPTRRRRLRSPSEKPVLDPECRGA